jgi:diguanylate cyclase (GGDEF)-like protein
MEKVLEAFAPYEHFCKVLLDAYVVVTMDGTVVKANPLFCQLVGKKIRQVLNMPFDHLISLSMDESIFKINNFLQIPAASRFDEVKGSTQHMQDMNLILGAYPLMQDEERQGIFLLIRDVTAETHLQDKYKVKATQSVTDKLTNLYNRAYFDFYLPRLVADMEMQVPEVERYLSVAMVDVDHFKHINDQYGHPGGDAILSELARVMQGNFRKTDVICRYGGEEFLIILPGTKLLEAQIAAEKLRQAVQTRAFPFQEIVVPVTVSVGVAELCPHKDTAEGLVARADAALYKAKEQGRNRVVAATLP